jgi:hypothetical protein
MGIGGILRLRRMSVAFVASDPQSEEMDMSRIMLAALLLAFGAAVHGQMYKWTDKDGKVHYSDMPPPQDAVKARSSPAAQASPQQAERKGAPATNKGDPAREGEPGGKFRPEEEGALGVMCALAVMQFSCRLEFGRYCTLHELVTGGPGGKLGSFERDPRRDSNYEYSVRIQGDDVTFAADPRRPGLAGFLNSPEGLVYNPDGRATAGGKRVRGGVNCQGFTK